MASLHDIGKISPGFQDKLNPNLKRLADISFSGYEPNHAEISEASFISWIKKSNQNLQDIEKWGETLGYHHGKRKNPHQDIAGVYGGIQWQEERHKLMKLLIDCFGQLPSYPPDSIEQRNIVSGFVSIADWIASDEEFFPAEGLPTETNLESHIQQTLDTCGWTFPEVVKV